jgi:organic radical activating enzyme
MVPFREYWLSFRILPIYILVKLSADKPGVPAVFTADPFVDVPIALADTNPAVFTLVFVATEPDVEGLSFLGGEPFNQAGALAEIGHYFRGLGYSLTTFTGFTYEALLSQSRQNHSFRELLSETDLLIDGPFIEKRIDKARPWLGSTNQKYRFLTDRYSIKDIDSSIDSVEITVDESGRVLINGWASIEQVKSLTDAIMVE